ncbi:hypothetical protein I352_03782 [Cryptococcus deuterogattii MMRL2647]|nr:hypothetical protein I352_03782 [Cryptococcus deuterogattii MMRL2647]
MGKFSEFLASSKEEQPKAVPSPPSYDESSTSAPPPTPPPPFPPSFGCIHLARSDRIRLLGLPPVVYDDVEQAIHRVRVLDYKEGPLCIRAWDGSSPAIVGQTKVLKLSKLDVLFVMYCMPSSSMDVYSQERYFFSISFNEGDKVRISDPPSEHVKQAFMTAVRTWPRGIQSEKEKEPGCDQFKLKALPWYTSDGDQVIHARLLGCTILTAMDSVGFELKVSVDMKERANMLMAWISGSLPTSHSDR